MSSFCDRAMSDKTLWVAKHAPASLLATAASPTQCDGGPFHGDSIPGDETTWVLVVEWSIANREECRYIIFSEGAGHKWRGRETAPLGKSRRAAILGWYEYRAGDPPRHHWHSRNPAES